MCIYIYIYISPPLRLSNSARLHRARLYERVSKPAGSQPKHVSYGYLTISSFTITSELLTEISHLTTIKKLQ